MPEKIILEDGTEKEILTDEEVKDLQAGHDANKDKRPIVEQFNKTVEALELKDGQTVEDRLIELKEEANPNFGKYRAKIKTLEKLAKDKGIEVGDDGNIVEKKEGLTKEEAEKIVEDTVSKANKTQQKEKALEGFSKDDAKVIGEVYDKLDAVGGSFNENISLAIEKVLPGQSENLLKQAIGSSGGAQPKQIQKGDITPELKSFGAEKFGITDDDIKNANK